jgi:hypothetical protein
MPDIATQIVGEKRHKHLDKHFIVWYTGTGSKALAYLMNRLGEGLWHL